MTLARVSFTPSILFLIAANIVPLWGVLFLGWSLLTVMLLFWSESAVIGIYNVFKMIRISWIKSLFDVPFFIFHYGMFMFGHFVLTLELFAQDAVEYSTTLNQVLPTLLTFLPAIGIPIIILFISHGFSFFHNFLGKKEYSSKSVRSQLFSPYGRIIIMHITVLLGGMLALTFQENILALVVLIVLKVTFDIFAHMIEHGLIKKIITF